MSEHPEYIEPLKRLSVADFGSMCRYCRRDNVELNLASTCDFCYRIMSAIESVDIADIMPSVPEDIRNTVEDQLKSALPAYFIQMLRKTTAKATKELGTNNSILVIRIPFVSIAMQILVPPMATMDAIDLDV